MAEARTGRRALLFATTAILGPGVAVARSYREELPWSTGEVYPPDRARPGPWLFLTPEEGATIEAMVDRLIPADELGPGGKESGCAVFIDRQLAGPYGRADGVYMRGPHPANPLPTQGFQSPLTPAQAYRAGLRGLMAHVRGAYGGRTPAQLSPGEMDALLVALDKGEVRGEGFSGKPFFEMVYANTMEGFFADPIYGGNRDMAGWKLIGFPGARYDYRDAVARPNTRYALPPVGLLGRSDWSVAGGRG